MHVVHLSNWQHELYHGRQFRKTISTLLGTQQPCLLDSGYRVRYLSAIYLQWELHMAMACVMRLTLCHAVRLRAIKMLSSHLCAVLCESCGL